MPARIVAVTDLPRTRSGKLAELAVADVVAGRTVRNREALANPEALDQFKGLLDRTRREDAVRRAGMRLRTAKNWT